VREFVTSKDGTKFPIFIGRKKGTKLDGTNPTLLYGYGGFNISLTPAYNVTAATWMRMGGVYVTAVLAAAANTARTGTKPAPSCTSKTCSTISSPPASG